MAKVSPVSIKYTISADFESEGLLEKPDVIGALFGQTEGLLGSDLELRELQKEGKIGRIDVELTTEGGLDVVSNFEKLKKFIAPLVEAGIIVSLFIDPKADQIEKSQQAGAQFIEFHTGKYAEAFNTSTEKYEFEKLKNSAELAHEIGLRINAGHGLNYNNVIPVAQIEHMEELNIGHSIISRAVMVGLDSAVRDMKSLIS